MDERLMEYEWIRQWEYKNPEPRPMFFFDDCNVKRTTTKESVKHMLWLNKRWNDWKQENL